MSTPARGRGGGAARASTTSSTRGRGSNRASTSSSVRGRGSGRGRGASAAQPVSAAGAGLLQKLRTGTVQRTREDVSTLAPRGRGTTGRGQPGISRRGRGSSTQGANAGLKSTTTQAAPTSFAAVPSSYRDFMAQMTEKFQLLKPRRDGERKRAIQDGFLADPEKKMSLANAITTVGTCTDMCPEFERVERIVQNMVDKVEKITNEASGRDMPAEERMIKRFRRSAAGYDEQLPSDIRTPETLRRTLDYLLDRVIGGGERLASIHKFVWDRTRGIRNDFSIQQVTRTEDVQIAVDCYERIARFHVLSLHQLSNPNNLSEGEHFDAHQEREQLNNTLLSLMYYYDDNRERVPLPNEPEFRAYCILFELQALTPDLEERMQSWPHDLLQHPKVQTAFKVYAAAGNTVFDQGPLRPLTPFSISQANSGAFWTILASQQVSYMMACVAEMNFGMVRFTALDALWRSGKSAPQGQQQKNQEWTLSELTDHLGFDDEEETLEFVQEFGLAFGRSQNGEQFLDFTSSGVTNLDRTVVPSQQTFSHEIVEGKRYQRTLVAVINGISVATAIREGLVAEATLDDTNANEHETGDDEHGMFVPQMPSSQWKPVSTSFGASLDPQAPTFKPSIFGASNETTSQQKPLFSTKFGETVAASPPKSVFGVPPTSFTSPLTASPSVSKTPFPSSTSTAGPSGTPSGQSSGASLFTNPFQNFKSRVPEFGDATTAANQSDPPSFTFAPAAALFTPPAPQPDTPRSTVKSSSTSVADFTPITKSQTPATFQGFGAPLKSAVQSIPPVSTFFGQNVIQPAPNTLQPAITQQAPLPAFSSTTVGQSSTRPRQDAATPLFPTSLTPSQPSQAAQAAQAAQPPQSGISTNSQPTFTFPQAGHSLTSSQTHTSSLPPFAASSLAQSSPILPAASTPPVFKFAQTSAQSPSPPDHKPLHKATGLQGLANSTTPLGSPQRVQPSDNRLSDLAQDAVPSGNVTRFQSSHTDPVVRFAATVGQKAPASSQPVEPPPSAFTEADRANLVKHAAQLALTQPQGLIDYIIGPYVSKVLQKVAKEYQKGVHDTILAYVKTQHLARKFFAIWKTVTKRKVLNRRGQQRRKLLAAAVQSEMEKQRRGERELESILAASQESKKLQEESRMRKQENAKSQTNVLAQQRRLVEQNDQLAGRKRKGALVSEHHQSARSEVFNGKSHKRSRTLSTSWELRDPATPMSGSIFQSPSASARFTQSFFGRSSHSQNFRRSLSSQKVDSTLTDYFKLKAMGIDPDTPLIPDTPKTLAERARRQEDERKALVSRIRVRDRSMSRSSSLVRDGLSMPPPPKPTPVSTQIVAVQTTPSKTADGDDGDDEFLRSMRAAREAMSQDAEWFRSATTALEAEIQQQEDLKQKAQLRTSGSAPEATVGLSNINGYAYLPGESQSRGSLSRTERRIRATGAHGLATKPVGIYRDYSPVAMSRKSASRLGTTTQYDRDSGASSPRKRAIGDVDLIPSSAHIPNGLAGGERHERVQSAKRSRAQASADHEHQQVQYSRTTTPRTSSVNMFAALNGPNSEDEEEEEEEGEKDQEENRALDSASLIPYSYVYNSNNPRLRGHDLNDENDEADNDDVEDDDDDPEEDEDGDDELYQSNTQSMPEEELVEDEGGTSEESEDEDESEDEEYIHTKSGLAYSVAPHGISQSIAGLNSGTRMNTTFEQTGPGASEDDALVLSD